MITLNVHNACVRIRPTQFLEPEVRLKQGRLGGEEEFGLSGELI